MGIKIGFVSADNLEVVTHEKEGCYPHAMCNYFDMMYELSYYNHSLSPRICVAHSKFNYFLIQCWCTAQSIIFIVADYYKRNESIKKINT